MFGDVVETPGRNVRHPRRGHRSRLPAPRKRNRPIALRLPYVGDGELLDAQRLSPSRRREDVEVAGEFRHDQGLAEGLAGRSGALDYAANALSSTDQLDGGWFARSAEDTRSLVRAERGCRAGIPLRG